MNIKRKTPFRNIAIIIAMNAAVLLWIQYGRSDEERYQIAIEAYQENNYSKTFNIMSSLAENNHPGAEKMLATLYSKGQGVEANEELATFWYNKAIENGYKDTGVLIDDSEIPAD